MSRGWEGGAVACCPLAFVLTKYRESLREDAWAAPILAMP